MENEKPNLKKMFKNIPGVKLVSIKTDKFPKRIVQYKPVVDRTKGRYTEICLEHYSISTGFAMRSADEVTLIGYCTESPRKVLETAFPKFNITRYNGYTLFDSSDFEKTTPMIGLAISPKEVTYGIEGKINELLELDDSQDVIREKPIFKKDIKKIIRNIRKDGSLSSFNQLYKQEKHNQKEITDILRKFL